MHSKTRFVKYDYSADRVTEALTLLMNNRDRYICLVADTAETTLVGALIAVLEYQIFSEQITASIMHFDVLPEARMGGYAVRLLSAFEKWANNRKIYEINFGINSGDEYARIGRFATKMGYTKVGENYVKALH